MLGELTPKQINALLFSHARMVSRQSRSLPEPSATPATLPVRKSPSTSLVRAHASLLLEGRLAANLRATHR